MFPRCSTTIARAAPAVKATTGHDASKSTAQSGSEIAARIEAADA